MLISQQFFPRLAHARGAGAGGRELHRLAAQQGALAGGLTALAAGALALGTITLVPRFLPAYSDAVGPMLIVLVGLVALAGASAYGNLLNLLDQQRTYLAIQVAALVVDVGSAVLLVAAGFGLVGVASASSGALVFYALLLRNRALAAVRDDRGPASSVGTPADLAADRQVGLDGA
jgi:O-antigen/teichoic acid export membrane protein